MFGQPIDRFKEKWSTITLEAPKTMGWNVGTGRWFDPLPPGLTDAANLGIVSAKSGGGFPLARDATEVFNEITEETRTLTAAQLAITYWLPATGRFSTGPTAGQPAPAPGGDPDGEIRNLIAAVRAANQRRNLSYDATTRILDILEKELSTPPQP